MTTTSYKLPCPSVVACTPAGIPAELQEWQQWVLWRARPNPDVTKNPDAKPIKEPFNAKTGRLARTADAVGKVYENTAADTWSRFEIAAKAFDADVWNGIGFVFTLDDPFCGIDLDKCRNPQTGELTPEAQAVVTLFNSYTEVSQSGTGVKILIKGRKPSDFTRSKIHDTEVYDGGGGRYFALTGVHLPGTPTTIEARQSVLCEFLTELFPPKQTGIGKPIDASVHPPTVADKSDSALLDLIANSRGAKFGSLWAGDTSEYEGDESRADSALAFILMYWCEHDIARADRLFRQSGLMRPKWDEQRGAGTYGEITLNNAFEKVERKKSAYEWRAQSGHKMEVIAALHHQQAAAPDGEETEESEGTEIDIEAQNACNAKLAKYPLTDLGNAERLIARHGDNLRYVHSFQKWHGWDNRRWQQDENGVAARYAKRTVRMMFLEAETLPKQAEETDESGKAKQTLKDKILAWQKKSESSLALSSLLKVAQTEAEVSITQDNLDQHDFLFNVANGTVDLRSGELRPHDRADYLTKLSDVPYLPDATCPLWLKFLERVLPDAEVRAYMQRCIGYTLTGSDAEQCLFFLYGGGSNGKSVFTSTIEKLMGEYKQKTRSEALMQKREAGIPNDVAALRGARLVTVSEIADGQRLAENLVKDLTGGDTIQARYLYGEFFNFRMKGKLWLYGNTKPRISGTDNGIWRRIRLIPFTVKIEAEERDVLLPEKLQEELPGILQWALQGFRDWQKRGGLDDPQQVKKATQEYRADSDVVMQFLEAACTTAPDERGQCNAKSGCLHKAYAAWCEASDEKAISSKAFTGKMKEKGFENKRNGKGVQWFGIRLMSAEELAEQERVQEEETEAQDTPEPTPSIATCDTDTHGSASDGLTDSLREMIAQAKVNKAYQHTNGEPLTIPTEPPIVIHDMNIRIVQFARKHQEAQASGDTANAQHYAQLLQLCQDAIREDEEGFKG